MADLKEVEYGRCPCGGYYESRGVEVTVSGLVLSGVPQGHCPKCTSRVYKLLVLQCIESAMRREHNESSRSR